MSIPHQDACPCFLLGLGRLAEITPQVVQPAGGLHDQIIIVWTMITIDIPNNSIDLRTANTMLDTNPFARNGLISGSFGLREGAVARLLLGLAGRNALRFIALKAGIFIYTDIRGICGVFFIRNLFIMTLAFIGLAQIVDFARMESANNEILDRVRFFLPL